VWHQGALFFYPVLLDRRADAQQWANQIISF
jgi:hypothetical protein